MMKISSFVWVNSLLRSVPGFKRNHRPLNHQHRPHKCHFLARRMLQLSINSLLTTTFSSGIKRNSQQKNNSMTCDLFLLCLHFPHWCGDISWLQHDYNIASHWQVENTRAQKIEELNTHAEENCLTVHKMMLVIFLLNTHTHTLEVGWAAKLPGKIKRNCVTHSIIINIAPRRAQAAGLLARNIGRLQNKQKFLFANTYDAAAAAATTDSCACLYLCFSINWGMFLYQHTYSLSLQLLSNSGQCWHH